MLVGVVELVRTQVVHVLAIRLYVVLGVLEEVGSEPYITQLLQVEMGSMDLGVEVEGEMQQ